VYSALLSTRACHGHAGLSSEEINILQLYCILFLCFDVKIYCW